MGIFVSRLFLQLTGGQQNASAVSEALSNHVVIRNIFSCLAMEDLKQCRLLNNFWNFQVSSYMRDLRLCHINISGSRACSDLEALIHVLHEAPIDRSVINSMSIRLGPRLHSSSTSNPVCRDSCAKVIQTMHLRYLEISWVPSHDPDECPVVQFIDTLFNVELKKLQLLKIISLPTIYCSDGWQPDMPQLGILHVQPKFSMYGESLRKILSGAPVLRKLTGKAIDVTDLEKLPHQNYHILDDFILSIETEVSRALCRNLAGAKPTLSALTIIAVSDHCANYVDDFYSVLADLLTSSSESLQSLTISSVYFPLKSIRCSPLVNTETLVLSLRPGEHPLLLRILQNIDFSRQLPVLSKVKVFLLPQLESIISAWTDDHAADATRDAYVCDSLRIIQLDAQLMVLQRNLCHIFPRVSSAVYITSEVPLLGSIQYRDLWAGWKHVEFLSLVEFDLSRNLDSDFLGIHPQEADLLRRYDDDDLEKLQVVPIRPSILTMLRLKEFKMRFHPPVVFDDEINMDRVFLSRLTGIVALRRMAVTDVHIVFVCSDDETAASLYHLLPFVSAIIIED